jgi:UDP-glucose:O-linked fucose beta-1,3-glucosyltransferase
VELAERKTKIYNLKMKYENVVNKMKKEEGEQVSQAHFVIKAAQEKEELQRQGDELDDKIRRAEKEIRALENTLGHLVGRNQRYKDNFQSANQQSLAEVEEKQMLEDQSRAANEVLFKKKKMLDQLEREGEEDAKRYDQFSANLDALDTHLAELTNAREALLHDIEDQMPKVERAEQSMQESQHRAATAGVDLGPDSAPTLDIETKGLRDMLQSLLYALGNSLQDHVEDVLPLFERLCDEKEIMRPSVPPSAPASAGSSRASSPQ